MIDQSILLEENQENMRERTERQLLLSKIQGLNDHLAALVQKKIRIDLEIRRTKKKLSKVKSQSKTLVKTRVSLEGFNSENDLTQDETLLFRNKVGPEAFKEYLKLDIEDKRSQVLLDIIQDLPLTEE